MKKIVILFVFITTTLLSYTQIGIQTNSPDASAALDIVATDKGLLIPRVTLTNDLTNASPVTSPATGLLVFNISAANQPIGLYFWDGSSWNLFNAGSINSDYWNLTGNSGTTVGTHFIGTTDAEDFAVYSNNTERMRFTSGGQGLIGLTTPNFAEAFVTIEGNATENYALNVFSPFVGIYSDATTYGVYSLGGNTGVRGAGGTYGVVGTGTRRGVLGVVESNTGSGGWFENDTLPDVNGEGSYGAFFVGSGIGSGYTLQNHSAGITSTGNDGIFATGKASNGIGIIAGGSNVSTFSTLTTGGGGAFTGYHGAYGSATSASDGVGIIGVGNDHGSYNTTSSGSGGAFTGYHGLISTAYDDDGTGIIGIGNGGSYYLYGSGSGGAFTGDYCGIAGWATVNNNNSIGVYGRWDGTNRNGTGVYGIANADNNRGYGVYGEGNNYGVYSNGDFGGTGAKYFVIDHPLDPENKILKHACIESPEVLNMYRGNVVLNSNGEATVQLPEYFISININFSYDLTPIGQPAPNLYIKSEINNVGEFIVSGGKANQKISWVVYTERNDAFMRQEGKRQVEVEKTGEEKGKYLMPQLYNQPPEKGIFYKENYTAKKGGKQSTISNESVKLTTEEIKKSKIDLRLKEEKK